MTPARERTLEARGKTTRTTYMRVTFGDREVAVHYDDLTIRERSKVRAEMKRLGLDEDDQYASVALAAWVIMLRDDPDLTSDEVVDSLTGDDLEVVNERDADSPEA